MSDPVALTMHERLTGFAAVDAVTPRLGAERGRSAGTRLTLDLTIVIDDLPACIAAPDHPARIEGSLHLSGLAESAAITEGIAQLYVPDADVGMKQVRYRGVVVDRDGRRCHVRATQFMRPGRASLREQSTAYVRILRDDGDGAGGVVAAGVVACRPWDVLRLLRSVRPRGVAGKAAWQRFLEFRRRELATPVPLAVT